MAVNPHSLTHTPAPPRFEGQVPKMLGPQSSRSSTTEPCATVVQDAIHPGERSWVAGLAGERLRQDQPEDRLSYYLTQGKAGTTSSGVRPAAGDATHDDMRRRIMTPDDERGKLLNVGEETAQVNAKGGRH